MFNKPQSMKKAVKILKKNSTKNWKSLSQVKNTKKNKLKLEEGEKIR